MKMLLAEQAQIKIGISKTPFFATYLFFVGGTNVEIVDNSGNPRL